MGVTGLWSIVQPCARPTKIETLNRKRLAVDASIWIYQFLKAVRDKEGNGLRNSHVVGFFRRICKLLFFGIKPVFVFDGGAPALKRSVIQQRKRRREGRRDDAVRTAGKLLAVQMQRRAEEEEMRRKEAARNPRQPIEEDVPDEGLVYAEELFSTTQEQRQNRTKFRKKDAYHLPDLDMSMEAMGGPNDPRVMSLEELQRYAQQFNTGEDVNVYDFSKIDYDSPFFTSLPASDRYNILNAARLRSRLRMGHSKEQLDTMFPDRMAFSKFQIERVTERNELTQRLMHVNEGGEGAFDGMGRVAGEKGREYVLVKNDGVEGGWALGVVTNEGRSVNEAINVDQPSSPVKAESPSDDDDDDQFEDVAVEGLNRLPKLASSTNEVSSAVNRRRNAFYRRRKENTNTRRPPAAIEDPDSLFIAQETQPVESSSEECQDIEDGDGGEMSDVDADLERAIALSLQKDQNEDDDADDAERSESENSENEDMLESFKQSAVSDALPLPKGSGRSIANVVNKRAFNAAPESHETTSFGVPVPRLDSDEDEGAMDLQTALAESRRTKRKKTPPGPLYVNVQPGTLSRRTAVVHKTPALRTHESASEIAKAHGFSGPLPFEKLDLGSSLLGKQKMQERQHQAAGGFDNSLSEKKEAGPLPPWFAGSVDEDLAKQREVEEQDRQRVKEFNERFRFEKANEPLRRHDVHEVIDLEADEGERSDMRKKSVIDLDADEESLTGDAPQPLTPTISSTPKLDLVAEDARANPPVSGIEDERQPTHVANRADAAAQESSDMASSTHESRSHVASAMHPLPIEVRNPFAVNAEDSDEPVEWSESEDEAIRAQGPDVQNRSISLVRAALTSPPEHSSAARAIERSPSADFEDVQIPDRPVSPPMRVVTHASTAGHSPTLQHEESLPAEEFDDFSDPEDEELMRSLAQEAEEHARFENQLNQSKTVAQNIAEYERELKQLRTQQKKDRRDADEVTHIMITECQQLLRLFGLPFITAPMEAEAQCAELVNLGLVDGIVTDDSDCFLFGGTRVYKNVFNQAKFVECYLATDLEKEFDLTRDKMIAVAQLLGSDYTEGLSGVGPVSALEIIAEFGNLIAFKEWWTGVQDLSISKEEDLGNVFRKKFRKNATKLFLPPAFPDERVNMAYLEPEVDSSSEPFLWGVPDLDALRSFLMATIGWSQERTDEVLVPVIKDMNRRADEGTQANITAFFDGAIGAGAAGRGQGGEAFAPRRRVDTSKRMGRAMGLLANQANRSANGRSASIQDADPTPQADAAPKSAMKARSRKRTAAQDVEEDESTEEDASGGGQKKRKKRVR